MGLDERGCSPLVRHAVGRGDAGAAGVEARELRLAQAWLRKEMAGGIRVPELCVAAEA